MRWDDGMRKILSPVGDGFVLYEYQPGRQLDGVPTRVRAAVPADSEKLTEYLAGRENVALQIQELAQAAGLDAATQKESGWGRSFARWVWPFGQDEIALDPERILTEEFESEAETDPWWWPFWSETAQEPSEPEPAATTSEAVNSSEPSTETAAPAAPETKKPASTKRDWSWPF